MLATSKNGNTVEPLKRGQHGNEPFVLSREVVLFRRLLLLSLKMKHSSCLDTNTTNKRERNRLSHQSVDVGSFCERLPCLLCKDGLLLVLSIKGELDNAHYSHAMCTTIRESLPALSPQPRRLLALYLGSFTKAPGYEATCRHRNFPCFLEEKEQL